MKEISEQYKAATDLFLNLVSILNEEDLDKSDSSGWTPRQVVHHVADSEAQSYARLRRLIAEPGSLIQGYDEGKWAENSTLDYKNAEIESSLAVFKAVRQSSYELLQRIPEIDLRHKCTHSETGEYSVKNWIDTYINHPREHAEQITRQIES